MGQKTSPIGFRTGIRLGWKSTWFAPKANYGECLVEDQKIRKYVDERFNKRAPYGAVSKTEIARTRNEVKVTLSTGRPGMVIGPRGAEVDKLREELEILIDRKVVVNVTEIKEPALNAQLVADGIGQQFSKRASFRRVMKQACETAMQCGAKGVKVICSGRLGGAEMARKETQKLGSIPLQTLDANVDYAVVHGRTTYGVIGVKVWIYLGKFGEEITPISRPPRRGKRGGPGGGGPGGGRKPSGGGRGGASGRPSAGRTPAAKPAAAAPVAKAPEAPAAPAVEKPAEKTESKES
jgi:small subunit ribosomal protein S3